LGVSCDGRSDGENDELPKGHLGEVEVIRSRRGLDPREGEEVVDKRMRGGHAGLDALWEGPRNVDEELLLRAEAFACFAGGRIVHAYRKLNLSENSLVFICEEFVIHGDQRAGLRGHGVHFGRVSEVDGD
jgi:hypothetical protein